MSEDPSFGILGLIDASECPPTYGARFLCTKYHLTIRHEDVKCFVKDGWKALHIREGDITHYGPIYQVDLGELQATPKDMVILLNLQGRSVSEKVSETLQKAKARGASLFSIHISDKNATVQRSEVKISDCRD